MVAALWQENIFMGRGLQIANCRFSIFDCAGGGMPTPACITVECAIIRRSWADSSSPLVGVEETFDGSAEEFEGGKAAGQQDNKGQRQPVEIFFNEGTDGLSFPAEQTRN